MGIKTKLGLGIASAALGLSLVGGGTYAYFNDKADAASSFAAGTLDLNAVPTEIVNVKDMKPGDWMTRTFKLQNDGTVDIKKVLLTTEYTVANKEGEPSNTEDLGSHIKVNFLYNADKLNDVIYSTTLEELKDMDPNAVASNVFSPLFEKKKGLKAGTTDDLFVQFEFVDNGEDQNQFQGDSLQLKWTFDGRQGDGQEL
ncbi:M73 family metallopeptidase [Metabacillus sp. KIGAM252]|uniref:M73 family metallopeptidase n=1 Tax=Metabacillus flavus TaxID=2823519 RepID=A0ABS5LG05_9BACI|nr:CalY family protein [Metabacillus flavus]MBS2969622.1 M73 family metallopeptidase [Metabacillus flavus]